MNNYKLPDFCNYVMGQSPSSQFYNSNREGLPFLQGCTTFGRMFPTFDTWTTQYTRTCKPNDVLMSVRAPVGDLNISRDVIALGRGVAALSMKQGDNRYLYYLLMANRQKLSSCSTGTIYESISKTQLENIVFDVHEPKEQRHIVDILGSIDEKIENNKKNATTLESLMDALFRKMLNDASDNWKQISLTEMAEYTNGLAMQKYRPTGQDSLPVVKIRELSQGAIDTNSELADPTINNKFTIDDGDIVFAWSGTLLVKIWCGGKAALNQHLFKVTSDNFPSWFLYLCTKQHLQKFQNIAKGKAVTMGHIKREDLEKSLVIIPPERIFSEYNSNIQTLYDKFVCLQQENKKLQELKGLYLKKFFE